MTVKFVHTNIIAQDWEKLAQFYINVFNCVPLYPERDLAGEWVTRMTRVRGAKIKGIHLQLPGYEAGPTLEIFQYEPAEARLSKIKINEQGYGHLAFHVDNVASMLTKVLQNGGQRLGEFIKKEIEGLGLLTVVYVQDPEGNIIEMQNWEKEVVEE